MRQSPFQILLIEDNDSDADLVKIHLKKLGLEYHLTRVSQKNDVYNFLENWPFDLVICDYNFPEFNGFDVLEYVRDFNPVLPFILISGYIGEEKAVDTMLKGASDYVLKDNLERLVLAVKRELTHFREQQEMENERDVAIQKLKERIKEQECLYNISNLDEQSLTISEMLYKAVNYLPLGFQHPENAAASIDFDGETYQTDNFSNEDNTLTFTSNEADKNPLTVSVSYLKKKSHLNDYAFLKEERHLLKSVAETVALKINRKLTQNELREKNDLLEKAYSLAQIGNWEVDLKTSEVFWSPTTKEIHEVPEGFEPDLETALNFYKAENDSDVITKLFNRAVGEGLPYDVELKIITAKNNERWVRTVGEPEFEDGKCVRLFGSIQNIDKRKRAEEELQKSEQRFKILVQDGSDLISIIDSQGYYKYVSPTSRRVKSLGMEQDEFAGLKCFDFMHEDDRERVRKTVIELELNERKEIEPYRFKNARGEWRWLETNIINLTDTPAVNGYVANSRDVTDRIEQERKIRDIVENSTNLFYRHDANHVITYISPQSQEFLGCSPEVAKKRWTEFATAHPANEEGFQKTIKAIETGVAQAPYELQLQKVTSEIIWVEVNEAPIVENGKTVAMVGSLTDITARKKYEEKLEELSLVASKTTDIIIMTDADEHITWVNDAYEKLTGYTLAESMGKIPGDFLQGPETDPEAVKMLREAIQAKESVQETILNYDKNGKKYWLDIKIDPLFEDGECTGFIAIERDVTARRETLDKLISTEQKLREIVEHSTNLFYKHDANHQLQYVSPQSYDFIGLKPEVAMKKWTDLITDHPTNEIGLKKTQKAIETGKPQGPYELQFEHTDGGIVWARVHEAPIVENGKTVAIVGSLTDITAHKKYEEKLEELSQIAAKTTDLIFVADTNQRITWVNNAFEKMTGYTLEESVGKLPSEFLLDPESEEETLQRIEKKLAANQTVKETIQILTKSGEKRWMDTTIDTIFDEEKHFTRYITIQKDVTEKIEREKALQESLERYNIVTKATSDTIWDADLESETVTYNSNVYNVFGYDVEEIKNSNDWWLSKIHPDDRERVDHIFKEAESSKTDRVQSEYRFECADGSYKYVNDRAHVINDEDGNPVRMIGAMQDITKQKEENIWLKLLESAIANTTEAIAILEKKSPDTFGRKILYVNDAFETMTGFKKDDMLGNSLLQLMGPTTDRKAILDGIRSLDRGEPYELEIAYNNKKEEEKWAQISFAPVRESDGGFSHWICIGRDATERRENERELRESLQEKETLLMEIHHRVKNNLAVVSSMMQLQAMKEKSESLQEKLYDSVARIRTMVTIHELLYESGSFSKIDFSVNLKKLVSMIIETIQSDKKIELQFDCESVELNVNQAIPTSLIVNEIITNAIKHAFTGSKKAILNVDLKELNDQVQIKLTDNGSGLPENFDKNDTSSLGLQLIDVLSKQMNAEYTYESSPGDGTIFTIQFMKSEVKGIGNAYLR